MPPLLLMSVLSGGPTGSRGGKQRRPVNGDRALPCARSTPVLRVGGAHGHARHGGIWKKPPAAGRGRYARNRLLSQVVGYAGWRWR